jgi:multicomponent Na+:H+ antiporter subunit D
MSHAIVLLVLVPLAGAFLISLVPDRHEPFIRGGVATLAALHCALVVRIVVDAARLGGSVYRMGGWDAPLGIVLAADSLSGFFLIVLCFGHLAFIIHALGEERGPRKSMWILTELLIAALSGIVVAGDLFNLFVFLELASVSSVGLMIRKQRAEGAGAGFVYLLYTSVSGVLYLMAVVLLYRSVGALSLHALALRGHEMPVGSSRVVVGLFIASIGMKLACSLSLLASSGLRRRRK